MKIRVKAEEIIYLEYFVDVPEEILEKKPQNLLESMAQKKRISSWIDENQSEFNYQDYDSDRSWWGWEEVTEKETA
jgi:hypothetical protein